jgi:site-specific recombinase XerD
MRWRRSATRARTYTAFTLMLDHGINPRVIQFLTGWTSLRMLDRYGHVRDTEIRRAVTSNRRTSRMR